MTPRIERLKQRSEFLRVAGTRRKAVMPGLILQAAETQAARDAPAGFRVGFTASRKVGGAVARNRAKRRLRATVDRVMAERAQPGHDYVVIARQATVDRPFAALTEDLEMALARLARRSGGAHQAKRGDER